MKPISPCYPRIGSLTQTWRSYTQAWRAFSTPQSLGNLSATPASAYRSMLIAPEPLAIGALAAQVAAQPQKLKPVLASSLNLLMKAAQASVSEPWAIVIAASSRRSRGRATWPIS